MSAQTKSVLIVDDNFNIRAALRAFIECTMEMQVCDSAGNGVDAITKASEKKPGSRADRPFNACGELP